MLVTKNESHDEDRFRDVAAEAILLEKGWCQFCGQIRFVAYMIAGKGFVQWADEEHQCHRGFDA
jgi:hypothetical protein